MARHTCPAVFERPPLRIPWAGRNGHGCVSERLVLLLLLAAWSAATPDSPLRPQAIYYQDDDQGNHAYVLAPQVALAESTGTVLRDFAAGSVETCATACRNDPECWFFAHCAAEDGCTQAEPHLSPQQCHLLTSNCSVRLQVEASGPWVMRLAGFPVPHKVPSLPGYEAQVAQGFDGGDYDCTGTLVPGLCAYGTVEDAVAACSVSDVCASIVYFLNGTDACSEPLAVLRSTPPSRNTTYVSPFVYTLVNLPGSETGSNGGGGGLSTGTIVGISVGAIFAGAAALAGGTWLRLRSRQRRLQHSHPQNGGKGGGMEDQLEQGGGGGQLAPPGYSASFHSSQHSKRSISGALFEGSRLSGLARVLRLAPSDGSLATGPVSPGRGHPSQRTQFSYSGGSGVGLNGGSFLPGGSIAPDLATDGPHKGVAAARANLHPSPFANTAPSPFAATAATPFAATAVVHHSPPSFPANGRFSPAAGTSVLPSSATSQTTSDGSRPASTQQSGAQRTATTSSDPPLPELEAYVAQQDAAVSAAPLETESMLSVHLMVSAESLPPSLRDCLIDITAIEFLRFPNGRLQEVGSGASGRVYKASYLGEVIAAKEIDIGRSRAAQEAFIAEAVRLHQLHHPHVVALYGVCLCGNTGLIVMEYCGGRDLHSVLQLKLDNTQERVFGWYQRGRRIAYDVAKAINFLHGKGMVHMDVKSSNVLLTGNGTAKLADVGLARLQKGTYLSEVPLVGTFAWIAPEVLLGGQQCTRSVDIYSFGVLLWEIITGERPLRGSLRAPRIPEECPQSVADLMMECVRLEPSQRPTAQQLMQRLDQLDARSRQSLDRRGPSQPAEQAAPQVPAAAAATAASGPAREGVMGGVAPGVGGEGAMEGTAAGPQATSGRLAGTTGTFAAAAGEAAAGAAAPEATATTTTVVMAAAAAAGAAKRGADAAAIGAQEASGAAGTA